MQIATGLGCRESPASATYFGPARSGSDGTRTRDLRRDRVGLLSANRLQIDGFSAAFVTFASPFYAPPQTATTGTRRDSVTRGSVKPGHDHQCAGSARRTQAPPPSSD